MLRAISVIVALIIVVATFAVLVSTQDITVEAEPSESITMDGLSPQGESTLAVSESIKTVEAKPSESITMDGLSPQGESTLAVACSTFLEPCKVTDSQNSIKTVEAKPSESITMDGLSPQGSRFMVGEAKPSESITMDGLSPQGESTLAEVVAGSKE
jgi:hypothetical protein